MNEKEFFVNAMLDIHPDAFDPNALGRMYDQHEDSTRSGDPVERDIHAFTKKLFAVYRLVEKPVQTPPPPTSDARPPRPV